VAVAQFRKVVSSGMVGAAVGLCACDADSAHCRGVFPMLRKAWE